MTKNEDVKTYAKQKKVCLWQIAEKLGKQEVIFSKMLRHELPADVKKKIFSAIDEIAAEENTTEVGK